MTGFDMDVPAFDRICVIGGVNGSGSLFPDGEGFAEFSEEAEFFRRIKSNPEPVSAGDA